MTGAALSPLRRLGAGRRGRLNPNHGVAIVVLAVAVATRALQYGNPLIQVDEQFYLLVGQRIGEGALPYVDVWDRKPVGLFLLYALFAAIGDGVLAYQLGATAFAAATAWVIVAAARQVTGGAGAVLAGVLYLCSLPLLGGDGGQSPVFYNLFMALAGLLVLTSLRAADGAAPLARGALAMLLVGVAIQIKYTAVFEGVFFGCALLVASRRRSGVSLAWFGHGLVWALAALVPTLLALAVYARLGHAAEFVQANFVSIFQKIEPAPHKLPLRLAKLVGLSLPVWATAVAGLRLALGGDPQQRRAATFVAAWLAVAILAVLAFGTWYDHYALPVLVPAAIAAAAAFEGTGRARALGFAAMAFGVVVSLVLVLTNQRARGDAVDLAPIVAAVGERPTDCLFIFSGNAVPYVLTRSCLPTRFAFPGHLSTLSEAGAIGTTRRTELRRIFARRPGFVLLRETPSKVVDRANLAMVLGYLARDYRLVLRRQVGDQAHLLYRRRDIAPRPASPS